MRDGGDKPIAATGIVVAVILGVTAVVRLIGDVSRTDSVRPEQVAAVETKWVLLGE